MPVATLQTRGDTVFVPDSHFPFVDPQAWTVLLDFVRYLKPKRVVHLGDHFDFYQLSKFDCEPSRLTTLQKDIDEGVQGLRELRAAAKDAEFHFIEGNHERRLKKFLDQNPKIAPLRCLEPQELLGLRELDIKFYPYEDVLNLGNFIVTHGSRVSKHAGMSAKGELEKWGVSGMSGHTHRMAAYNLSNYGGDYVWYEAGCICSLNPHYIVGRPNWQQGITIGDFHDGDFTIHQLRFSRKYEILHHGKRFSL